MVSPPLLHAESGFVANPTNNTAGTTAASDPNYSTYQNLGLGFSMKYLKNMTIFEQTDNRSAFSTSHKILFTSPHIGSSNFKGIPHLRDIRVLVTPATGAFGIPMSLDDGARQIMLGLAADNSTTITSKTKGSLNSLPAHKIELESMTNPVNYTSTTTKIPLHVIFY